MIPVQFITNSSEKRTHLQSAEMALRGGCKWIQLRMKDYPECRKRETAVQVLELCKKCKSVLIIDDDVILAKEIGADGVHLGKKDTPVNEARRILGQGMIIGATANTFDDIVSAKQSGADYIGLGPLRFTKTKKGLSPVLGLNGYKEIIKRMEQSSIDIPVVAVGGITLNDVSSLIQAGVNGIAVSGAILNAKDGAKEMEAFLNITI